ncbi:MAG TPA: Na+/H+ antiporter subunit E [Longimicrobiales bacterium]|nr:Na+/H+ antiporter subunit E [Longimicrobiales bacterium]
MTAFLWNLFLAAVWMASTGRFTLADAAFGFLIGFAVLWFSQRFVGRSAYVAKVVAIAAFALFFLRELIEANVRVAYDVITHSHHMRPGVVAVPLDATTDTEIALIGSLLSLTPGTLTVDVSPDRGHLYIHAMYIDDPDAVRARVKGGFERRVLELLR